VQFSTRRAALIGAVLALVCIAAVTGAAVLGNMSTGAERDSAVNGPVLIAVVLPDADGVLTLRQLDMIQRVGTTLRVTGVDPLTSATVPGTSAKTLADAFSFGGGAGVASAVGGTAGEQPQAWIVVGPAALQRLLGAKPVSFGLREEIQVFDGTELYSFPAGTAQVPAEQVARLMDGAVYLDASDRTAIRSDLGDAVVPALVAEYAQTGLGIDTNLTVEQLGKLFGEVKSVPVRADKSL
jgi:hypothetical protein